jgi:hypothetical protein
MSALRVGVNTIRAGEVELLLSGTGSGTAVHLSAAVGSGEVGRDAVPEDYRRPWDGGPSLEGYDLQELARPRWKPMTLCGREWLGMAPGDGGAIYWPDDDLVYAPTCKRCLTLMDRHFPAPDPAPHLPLVVQLLTDLLTEHGYAEIHSVPGDQQQILRSQVRAKLRERAGCGSRTFAHESMVAFWSDAIRRERREAIEAEMRQALEQDSELTETGEAQVHQPEWRLNWDTWRTS